MSRILTIKDIHQYYSLVTEGKAPRLDLPGCDGYDLETLLIPRVDGEERVYFHDLSSGSKVYPGKNVEDQILSFLTFPS